LLLSTSGCDWSSGGGVNSFNTSQGAGFNLNFSGFYRGELSGGRAVEATSGGTITSFTVNHVGNSLTVVDNNGSTYQGTVGSPGVVSDPINGVYPAGAELVQSQVSWKGRDIASGQQVEFVGIIHVVSVIDIEQEIESSSSTETTQDGVTTTVNQLDENTVETITVIVDGETTTTITTVTDSSTGEVISSSTTSSSTETESSFDGYQITEANSQYRLEGTWIEEFGLVSRVQARSAGSAGLITVEEPPTEDLTDPGGGG
jgi:hypothetical protein